MISKSSIFFVSLVGCGVLVANDVVPVVKHQVEKGTLSFFERNTSNALGVSCVSFVTKELVDRDIKKKIAATKLKISIPALSRSAKIGLVGGIFGSFPVIHYLLNDPYDQKKFVLGNIAQGGLTAAMIGNTYWESKALGTAVQRVEKSKALMDLVDYQQVMKRLSFLTKINKYLVVPAFVTGTALVGLGTVASNIQKPDEKNQA